MQSPFESRRPKCILWHHRPHTLDGWDIRHPISVCSLGSAASWDQIVERHRHVRTTAADRIISRAPNVGEVGVQFRQYAAYAIVEGFGGKPSLRPQYRPTDG